MLELAAAHEKRFAYGFWRYREDEVEAARTMLALARESGIHHIDTADVYGGQGGFGGAERLLGAIRKRAPALFQGAVLATKAGVEIGAPYNSARAYIMQACDASLVRLGVDRIDLFYIHRHDFLTHPGELAETLDGLVASGKVGAVGVSNFSAAQIDALRAHLKTPLVAHQIEFSAAHAAPLFDGVLDQAMGARMAVAAWSPLAGGRLGAGDADPRIAAVRALLEAIADEQGVPMVAAALTFIQMHPAGVTPILGTKTPERLRDCLRAAECTLSRPQWYRVLEASIGAKMP